MGRKSISLLTFSCIVMLSFATSSAAENDIVDTIASTGNFKTLTSALKEADLVDTLKGKGPFTVFAPTDEAFEKLPQGALQELLKPENKQKLQALLKQHVVPEKLTASELEQAKHLKTAAGAELDVAKADGKVTIGKAHVTKADILCSNGVIHVIDVVLDAPSTKMKEPVAAANERPYLGIGVEPLHRAFMTHLLQALGKGRGVMVSGVGKDSPAEKMGLERDDIIVSYDDQQIYSPDQLVKLIQADKSGREVKLGIVRHGKNEILQGTLGHHQITAAPQERERVGSFLTAERFRHRSHEEQRARWLSFDSLNLGRSGDGRFKAEIKYRDNNGKFESKSFEGSREDIRERINSQQDLPANERQHLLRALDLLGEDMGTEAAGAGQSAGRHITWDFYELER